MTNQEIVSLARDAGFTASEIVDTKDIVFDPVFLDFCKENLCRQYNASYSCPPDCGSPEAMKQRILAYPKAVVVQSQWVISDLSDKAAIKAAKRKHNYAMLDMIEKMKAAGHTGLMAGASNCCLCETCKQQSGEPCVFPDQKFSCMSAYCIYVKNLAERCGMEYFSEENVYFFGLYAFL